ncbi:MAG: DnaJ domain-containing protein [Deltaproteobacteria bacterium]|nr:DnaJ domain-containing protein [Deltaproteobacteria bacterium]
MDYTDPSFWPQLKDLARRIDSLDYYQILNLPSTAPVGQISAAYYGMARALHPDKFFHLPDNELKAAVNRIYKRITEAHGILKDDVKRKRYTEAINGPNRAQRLRFDESMETETQDAQKAALKVAKTPKGDELWRGAQVDIRAGRFKDAHAKIKSALLFEPGNAELKKLLGELDKKK